MKITAREILKLLEKKYPIDKFLSVAECKTGPTYGGHSRFDMWAMARSWKNPRFIGFEIKVSRSDFLKDEKWRSYLKYCTEFYFVAPSDIIAPEEVPDHAGLLTVSKNCKRLTVRKKAPVRDFIILRDVLLYVLMCRTKITSNPTKIENAEIWRQRLEEMKADKNLGSEVAYYIKSYSDRRTKEVRRENDRLISENNKLLEAKKCLEKMGIDLETTSVWSIQNKLERALSSGIEGYLEQVDYNTKQALKVLKEVKAWVPTT